MRLRVALAVSAAALVVPPSTSAGIIINAPARKICVGGDGGGIRLSVSLNHGDKPGRRFWFLVRIFNPAGRAVYGLKSYVYEPTVEAVNFTPRRLGVYQTVFEAYGWRRTVFRTRVFACE